MWHPFKSAWQQTETGRGLQFSDRTCRIERDTEEQRKRWLCTHGVYPPQSALSSKISSQETERKRKLENKGTNIMNIIWFSTRAGSSVFISFPFIFVIMSFSLGNVILSFCHSLYLWWTSNKSPIYFLIS